MGAGSHHLGWQGGATSEPDVKPLESSGQREQDPTYVFKDHPRMLR